MLIMSQLCPADKNYLRAKYILNSNISECEDGWDKVGETCYIIERSGKMNFNAAIVSMKTVLCQIITTVGLFFITKILKINKTYYVINGFEKKILVT